jgi:putative CocE/NonD family hydrolase
VFRIGSNLGDLVVEDDDLLGDGVNVAEPVVPARVRAEPHNIVRLRYRNGRERSEPVTPGVPVQVTITLYPTSNLFMPGHRIRLDISSSNHPRFDVKPNTGEPPGRDRRRVVADNTVFHERGRTSCVVLPIIPA